MFLFPRPQLRDLAVCLVLTLLFLCLPSWAAEKVHFGVDDYQIDATLNPHDHIISARARVKITALVDLDIATFHFHYDFRLTRIADADGYRLTSERLPLISCVR